MTNSKPFKLGHSNKNRWQDAIDDCLQQTGESPEASLAFLYVTDGYAVDLGEILRSLKKKTGISHWVGSVGTGLTVPISNITNSPQW